MVLDKPAEQLLADDDVREFYLGLHAGGDDTAADTAGAGAGTGRKSFRDVKHYKRRKRWLS